jgi:uncharacterized protein (DUF1330 family)
MPEYFIIELDVDDGPELTGYERAATPHGVAAGARFLVRGGRVHTLSGQWEPKRIVMEVFPAAGDVQAYYDSDANKQLTKRRIASTGGVPTKAIGVEGLPLAEDSQPGTLARQEGHERGSVYLISDFGNVREPASEQALATSIADAGGRLLARSEAAGSIEGDWTPALLLLAEFADLTAALSAHANWTNTRGDNASAPRVIAVEGLSSAANTAPGAAPVDAGVDSGGAVIWR